MLKSVYLSASSLKPFDGDIEGLYVEALVNAAVLKYSYGVVRLRHLETGKDNGAYVLKCSGARRDLVQLNSASVKGCAKAADDMAASVRAASRSCFMTFSLITEDHYSPTDRFPRRTASSVRGPLHQLRMRSTSP